MSVRTSHFREQKTTLNNIKLKSQQATTVINTAPKTSMMTLGTLNDALQQKNPLPNHFACK